MSMRKGVKNADGIIILGGIKMIKTKCIRLWIDEDCEHCKKVIKEIGVTQPNIPKDKVLVIIPDYNAYGILTHYHLSLEKKEKKEE